MGRMKEYFLWDAPKYPASPGYKEPTTSLLSAVKAAGRAPNLRHAVMNELAKRPGTADEIAQRLGESILTIRPRLSELRASGRIVPTGERRKNASGNLAIEWRIKAL